MTTTQRDLARAIRTDEQRMRQEAMYEGIAEARVVLARLTPIPSPAQRARAEMLAEFRQRRLEQRQVAFLKRLRARGEL